ncbi:beta-phosphoglucomutase family hydrolase [Chlorobium sp. N1]|uniref:HAD family hydrolase n=1 Tax=Chlorobium sp. N1 TaxID=2491138 RepID=UPI00103BDE61|nr:beta-phosphoglucomutase family hydrolase [Chlorobium sp. N1]TCD48160.1 beta-phosphoglucomutase family hydrolase [Chlorobium sp. N1]
MMDEQGFAFIFDMDGVLTDNMSMHAESWVEVFRDRGLEGLDARRYMVEAAGMHGHDVLRHFLDPDITAGEAHQLSEMKDFLYRVMSRELIRPMAGLLEFLDAARSLGIKLAVGTGAVQRNIDFVLGILGLEDAFGAIVCADDVPRGKPAPDIFLRASELVGVPPSSCIVFEDAIPGLEAARSAGMPAVGVTTTNSAGELSVFENVVRVIDDFRNMDPDALRKLALGRHLSNPA